MSAPLLYNASLMPRSLRIILRSLLVVASLFTLLLIAPAQQTDAVINGGLRWRSIGPFRGGRSIAVSGIEGQPNVYYFGSVGGGVWKTTNAGETWGPLFGCQPIGSIGGFPVWQSKPCRIYFRN